MYYCLHQYHLMSPDGFCCIQFKSLQNTNVDIDLIEEDEVGERTCSCLMYRCQFVFKWVDSAKIMLERHFKGLQGKREYTKQSNPTAWLVTVHHCQLEHTMEVNLNKKNRIPGSPTTRSKTKQAKLTNKICKILLLFPITAFAETSSNQPMHKCL